MNGSIRRKLMEAENQPSSMEQWYRRAIALNRNWRESRKKEEDTSPKIEPTGGIETNNAMTISVVEKARNATSVGDNRAHSNRRS